MLQRYPLLHYFLLYVFIYGQLIDRIALSRYYLMWKLIQDPGTILASLFQSATGTWIVYRFTITQTDFL